MNTLHIYTVQYIFQHASSEGIITYFTNTHTHTHTHTNMCEGGGGGGGEKEEEEEVLTRKMGK